MKEKDKTGDCQWTILTSKMRIVHGKRDDEQEEDESDLGSSGSSGSHTRPQKRARTRYASHPGRVSLESDYRAAQRALDFDEGIYNTEDSFGSGLMAGV